MITSKRVNVKGHYRVIERDEMGKIVSSNKWTNPKRNKEENHCPRCNHFTLKPRGTIQNGELEVWACSRCSFKAVREKGRKVDE